MGLDVILPQWLDELIFGQLGAKYCRSNADMTVIDWDKNDVLNYLGTYFPRSYAESYCIFSEFFSQYPNRFVNENKITVFDFGCGTGGEIIGLLSVLITRLSNIESIKIVALDGNEHALSLYQKVLSEFKKQITSQVIIESYPAHVRIDDFYDLSILERVLYDKYDIILSSKAICEFVSKQQFETENAYKHISKCLLPKLKDNGIFLLVDVTTYNNVSQKWLPSMLDNGLAEIGCKILSRNEGYNQLYYVSHSKCQNDLSKVAWRMVSNN